MQHKPRMGGIIVTAVLLVLVLVMATTYSSMAQAGATTMKMSEVMNWFSANQVTYFNLDLNTGEIELSLKEGAYPLPDEADLQAQRPSGGFLTDLSGLEDEGPQNGGIVTSPTSCPTRPISLTMCRGISTRTTKPTPTPPWNTTWWACAPPSPGLRSCSTPS